MIEVLQLRITFVPTICDIPKESRFFYSAYEAAMGYLAAHICKQPKQKINHDLVNRNIYKFILQERINQKIDRLCTTMHDNVGTNLENLEKSSGYVKKLWLFVH